MIRRNPALTRRKGIRSPNFIAINAVRESGTDFFKWSARSHPLNVKPMRQPEFFSIPHSACGESRLSSGQNAATEVVPGAFRLELAEVKPGRLKRPKLSRRR